eukprot:CAMPEP_0206326684 /NCGR_PEP_ID=MMETSP0106_2-20121207/21746_1 /ASSEMBLY_ACC=CAM_ASM_000206 /TAXON_ID=81532 /ORGANISM="Acanthoeca-like sp., Strain 10tr" /LENGTH=52 /DNA_ID=CAMNT_0053759251 /DNA_START=448 /DNA_END=606 /DNA_ORIENTATION=-
MACLKIYEVPSCFVVLIGKGNVPSTDSNFPRDDYSCDHPPRITWPMKTGTPV